MQPLALTIGEPAGIGPDIVLQLWHEKPALFSDHKITIIGNRKLLQARANQLGIDRDLKTMLVVDIPLPAPCENPVK